MASLFSSSLRPAFRALAICFVPETARATPAQWTALEAEVERALDARPELRPQLVLFIRLLDLSARFRYAHSLARLDPVRGDGLLRAFAASPVLLFRRGVWGLRTLVFLGWYTQPDVIAGLGYRAHPAGWEARR